MQVQSPGQECPLEEQMATHSSILAWKTAMDRGAWRATVHGVTKSLTQLSTYAHNVPEPKVEATYRASYSS